jgi:Recombination enhancement, RecA-dependent nuclease
VGSVLNDADVSYRGATGRTALDAHQVSPAADRTHVEDASAPEVEVPEASVSKKAPTRAEREYMGRVAALGCAVCRRLGLGETPAVVHHQRTGTGAMRAPHYYTAPLCPPHHQFSGYGLHDMGRPQFEEMYGFSEVDLVQETRQTLWAYLPESERRAA